MSRKIAGWTIQLEESGGVFAKRDRDSRSLRVSANPFFDPVGQSLRSLLTDLLNEAAPATATVAVDAGALEALREAVGYLDKQPVYLLSVSRARAELLVMEAARRLLAGDK